MTERRAIHAFLSGEAHDTWHDVAATHGVSVSGLLEALALDWAEGNGLGDAESASTLAVAKSARRIDAERRRRSRV